jgi:hypothetical protein
MRDRARKRAEERESQGGGGTKYSLPENVNFYSPKKHASLDIIPYTVSVDNHPEDVPKGELWYQRTIFVHYGIGSEEKSYLCLKTIKKKCPICEQRSLLMKDSNSDEEIIKALRPKERELFNIYDREDPDKGVQLWDISNFNFGAKLEEELREGRPEWAGFAEPVDGFTLKVRFSEEQIGKNKFMQASRIDFDERKSIDKKHLSQALDLDKILKVLSYEQLEKIFLGVDGENVDDVEVVEAEKEAVADKDEDTAQPSRPRARESNRPGRKREQDEDTQEVQHSSPSPSRERPQREEPERSSARSATRESKSKTEDQLVCPAGGTFGKDCDELKACRDCAIWDKCIEEQDRLSKK